MFQNISVGAKHNRNILPFKYFRSCIIKCQIISEYQKFKGAFLCENFRTAKADIFALLQKCSETKKKMLENVSVRAKT